MKLILSGGGSGKQTIELDSKFVSLVDKSKPLLYIPVAIDTKTHPYPGCLEWLKETFDSLGIKKYEMWTEEDLFKGKKIDVKNFGGIYIGGGNTPYLLKTLKESGMWKFLKDAIKENIPIYGGSAGAIIFAKSIIPSLSADENKVHLKNFDGMNLISNKEVWCHYGKNHDKRILEFIEKYNLKEIIALPEETGLFIGKDIRLIGKKSGYLFTKEIKKEIKVGGELK